MKEKIWNRDFVLLILSNFLMYITYYAILSALPVYLVSDLHASKMQVGLVVGVYTIASVLVRPFSGFALDKFGRRTIFLSGLIIYTFLLVGYLVALSITSIILLRFAQGLTWGFTTVSGSTIAVDNIPTSKRGEGIGYFSLSTTLGMSVGPVIGDDEKNTTMAAGTRDHGRGRGGVGLCLSCQPRGPGARARAGSPGASAAESQPHTVGRTHGGSGG